MAASRAVQIAQKLCVVYVLVKIGRHLWIFGLIPSLKKLLLAALKAAPGGQNLLNSQIDSEASAAVHKMLLPRANAAPAVLELPKRGLGPQEALALLQRIHENEGDIVPREGKAFAYVYDAGEEHTEMLSKASSLFMHTNGLSPLAFPSLRRLEVEIVAMASRLLNGGEEVCGSVTSGGTESIFLAMKTYRDRARALHPGITEPEVIMCVTAHPAFNKAAHYLGIKLVIVPADDNAWAMSIFSARSAITRNTIAIVASAPQYPHGVMDPIPELALLAQKHCLPLHVDSCVGGFVLPFVERLGFPVVPFDFRLPGVTSMSADLHKYGFAAKGASVVLYRSPEIRKYQFYGYTQWPGGLYISPTTSGTRAGAPFAAAYAALVSLGEDGFMRIFKEVMETTQYIVTEINQTPELEVIGSPCMTIVSFRPRAGVRLSIFSVADVMESKGWKIERNAQPQSIHCTLMPQHTAIREKFVADLRECIAIVKADPEKYLKEGSAAMYGMLAQIPDPSLIDSFLYSFADHMYRPAPAAK